jgi:arginine/serine-rich splicing factor 4/5/6
MGGHRVYIGRLARDASKRDLEDLFKSYGKILDVTVKTGFGFVEFAEKVDAEDAVHDFHDTRFLGQKYNT